MLVSGARVKGSGAVCGVLAVALAAAVLWAPAAAGQTPACAADKSWVTNPSMPTEIPGGGTDFCQFYQFGWQAFLYLVSPSGDSEEDRNFEVWQDYPTLQATGTNSCATEPSGPQLFVRTLKADDEGETFVIPERIGQAGDEATIYDQNGNVVFYDVRFSRNLCTAPTTGDLPAGTVEMKTSWRQLQTDETAGYFTMQAVIQGVSTQPLTLGLVGFHLFVTTAQHPEGVWLTWEHDANDPDCLQPQSAPAGGWSFTSAECAQCLATSTTGPLGCASCGFNAATQESSLTGTPTEICRVYRDGTAATDHEAAENFADVDSLNQQLVGPGGILTSLPADDPMAVWASYFNVGGLWVSDPTQPATTSNQRGSIQLSNTTMETTFQGNFQATGSAPVRTGAVNCFGCHNYTPGSTRTTGLSHIIDDIASGESSAAKQGGHELRFVPAHHPPAAPVRASQPADR